MVRQVSARTARRIATAAAYGGGGIGLVSATLYGLLRMQAELARRTINGRPLANPPDADGLYGSSSGAPLSFVVLGDSAAVGYGAPTPGETPGARLAKGLADSAGRPVRLTTVGAVGAQSTDLADQVDKALTAGPDIAMIVIGGNDVTHNVHPPESVRLLIEAVRRLRDAGGEVVVGTCPDLGTIRPIRPPLRWLARRMSRQLAAAQAVAVVETGGRSVSLGSILGPEFEAAPGEMFSEDQFHPSAAGYAHASSAILPSLLDALHLTPEGEDAPDALRGDSVLPVAVAAAAAADQDGAEVAATTVHGRDRGSRGRWAQLRIRRRKPLPDPPDSAADEAATVMATGP